MFDKGSSVLRRPFPSPDSSTSKFRKLNEPNEKGSLSLSSFGAATFGNAPLPSASSSSSFYAVSVGDDVEDVDEDKHRTHDCSSKGPLPLPGAAALSNQNFCPLSIGSAPGPNAFRMFQEPRNGPQLAAGLERQSSNIGNGASKPFGPTEIFTPSASSSLKPTTCVPSPSFSIVPLHLPSSVPRGQPPLPSNSDDSDLPKMDTSEFFSEPPDDPLFSSATAMTVTNRMAQKAPSAMDSKSHGTFQPHLPSWQAPMNVAKATAPVPPVVTGLAQRFETAPQVSWEAAFNAVPQIKLQSSRVKTTSSLPDVSNPPLSSFIGGVLPSASLSNDKIQPKNTAVFSGASSLTKVVSPPRVTMIPPNRPFSSLNVNNHTHSAVSKETIASNPCDSSSLNSFYGLPDQVRQVLAKRGIRDLYAWQKEVLSLSSLSCADTKPLSELEIPHDHRWTGSDDDEEVDAPLGIGDGGGHPHRTKCRGLVYSLPTSGGKSLVADIALLRGVVVRKGIALLILPYVALVEEKKDSLEEFGDAVGFRVDGYHGVNGRFPVPKAPVLCVCTIEKGNSVINHLAEEKRLHEVCVVVVDELHMVGDAGGEGARGAILEMLLSKVVYACPNVQIVGMSATIPNLGLLSGWLGVEKYESVYRPTALKQFVALRGTIYDAHTRQVVRQIDPVLSPAASTGNGGGASPSFSSALEIPLNSDSPRSVTSMTSAVSAASAPAGGGNNKKAPAMLYKGREDSEGLLPLVLEVCPEGSILVFCATKAQCSLVAQYLCRRLPSSYKDHRKAEKMTLVHDLQSIAGPQMSTSSSPSPGAPTGQNEHSGNGADHILQKTVVYGVGIHHGGLLSEERELLERAFRNRVVVILCCTSTLAAGVNLPARRVILRSPMVGLDVMPKAKYLQMCGRAGRAGMDPAGESYLLLTPQNQAVGWSLISKDVESLSSSLLGRDPRDDIIQRFVLESIGCGIVRTAHELRRFARKTLWYFQRRHSQGTPDAIAATRIEIEGIFMATLKILYEAKMVLLSKEKAVDPQQVESSAMHEPGGDGDALPRTNSSSSVGVDGQEESDVLATASSLAALLWPPTAVSSAQTTLTEGAGAPPSGPSPTPSSFEQRIYVSLTPFGVSAYKGTFSVGEAQFVYEEIERVYERGLILKDELHLCYLITPFKDLLDPDWTVYMNVYNKLSIARQRISEMIGVNEGLLMSRVMTRPHGRASPTDPFQATTDATARASLVLKRFFVAMVLCDLVNEVPMPAIELKYKVNRGQLQGLLKSAQMFANMMVNFCKAMEWFSMERVLSGYVKRLGFGTKPDLVPLTEIKGVQACRARMLWNAGYRTVKDIAAAEPEKLLEKIKKKCANNNNGGGAAKFLTLNTARAIVRNAGKLVRDTAKELRQNADDLLR